MNLPIDYREFSDFIDDNNLFEMTRNNLQQCLRNWSEDDKVHFLEDFNSEIDIVLKRYKFENSGVSCSKSFFYEPPLDYFSVWIRISDEEDRYLCKYTAFYDLELNCFDDKITR